MRPEKLLPPAVYGFGIASLSLLLAHKVGVGNRSVFYGLFAGFLNTAFDLIPYFRVSTMDLLTWRYILYSAVGGAIGLAALSLPFIPTASELTESAIILAVAIIVRMVIRFGYSWKRKSPSVVP